MYQEKYSQENKEEIIQKKPLQQPKTTDKTTKISFDMIDEATHNNQIQTTQNFLRKSQKKLQQPQRGFEPDDFEELMKAIESTDPKMHTWGLKGLKCLIISKKYFQVIQQRISKSLMKSIINIAEQSQSEQVKKESLQILKSTLKDERISKYSLQLGGFSTCLQMIKELGDHTESSTIWLLTSLANKTKASKTEFYQKGGLKQLVNLYLKSKDKLLRTCCVQSMKSLMFVTGKTKFPIQLKSKQQLSSLCRLLRGLQSDETELEDYLVELFQYYAQNHLETRQVFAEQHIIEPFIEKIKVSLSRYSHNMKAEVNIITQLRFIQRLIYQNPSQIDIVLNSKLLEEFQSLLTKQGYRWACFNEIRTLIVSMFTGNNLQIRQMLNKTKSLKFVRHFKKIKNRKLSKYVFQIVRNILKQAQPQIVFQFFQDFKIMQFFESNLHLHSVQGHNVNQVIQNLGQVIEVFKYAQKTPIFLQIGFVQAFKNSIRKEISDTLLNHQSAIVRRLAHKMIIIY